VAVVWAAAAVCLSKVWTRIEAGELGEWNKVITSLTPAWFASASEQATTKTQMDETYFLEESLECAEHFCRVICNCNEGWCSLSRSCGCSSIGSWGNTQLAVTYFVCAINIYLTFRSCPLCEATSRCSHLQSFHGSLSCDMHRMKTLVNTELYLPR
jgi:hypothetical protein